MTKPLLIMKTGNTVAELLRLGADFEHWFCHGLGLKSEDVLVVSVHENEPLPDLESVSAIVITGSPAYVTDLEQWNFVAADYIRAAFALKLPMLGVCYGHQLIAWAFNGEVDFHPKGREIGTVTVRLNTAAADDRLLQGLPVEFAANVSHQQSVTVLPNDAVLLASNDFEPNHGFRIGSLTWGVQFHPEFNGDITRTYIQSRRESIQREGIDVDGILAKVADTPASAGILSRFMSIVLSEEAS